MLRVLTLATLFPNRVRPTLGIFVERQTLGLAASEGVEVEVVAPIGLPAWPLSMHPHYRPLRSLPLEEEWKGLKLHRPRYRVRPLADPSGTVDRMVDRLHPLLARIQRNFPFDLIDAEFFWPDGPAAMRLSAIFGVPFSVKGRGSDIHLWGRRPDTGPQVLDAARGADGLLAVSEGLKADMVDLGFPAGKVRVHHTGVDLDRFQPCDRKQAKQSLGLNGPILVTPGALIPRKGQAFAIKTLRFLPEATLLLIGEGPDRKMLERLTAKLGLGGRVKFLGNRPHSEMPRWLAAADVMLLPTASEGLANVWVEALACGTPVVTTDIPGADEVITDEVGRRVDRSAKPLACAVRELLERPIPQQKARLAAEKFSWALNSAQLVEHFRNMIERGRIAKAA
jgi:teichuronic acid biosynthesis glycosyltransferase TuaC